MVNPKLIFMLTVGASAFFCQQLKARTPQDPNLEPILQKHLEAMGGLYNWNQAESIRLKGTIERNGEKVDIVIVKKRPNQIRATVTVPIPNKEDEYFQIIRAHDGKTAWTATRLAGASNMTKEELPTEAADELLADAGVLPLLIKFWREGAELKLLSPQRIDGEINIRIRTIDTKSSFEYTFYISEENFLVTRYESIDSQQRFTQTKLSDYIKVNGILIPTQNTTEATQTGHSLMNTSSIEIGVGIYKEYFEVGEPPETAGL
ncbi:MAG: hypothetical protein ACSHX8_01545 [Opitutaceae bacterium]